MKTYVKSIVPPCSPFHSATWEEIKKEECELSEEEKKEVLAEYIEPINYNYNSSEIEFILNIKSKNVNWSKVFIYFSTDPRFNGMCIKDMMNYFYDLVRINKV